MNPAPATDQKISQRYTAKSLEKKEANKLSLQEEFGWPLESKRPMICLPAGMSDALGGALLEELIPGLFSLPLEILVVGQGSNHYGELFTKLSKENNHRLTIVLNEDTALRKMYAASDMALFLSDPSGMPELSQCLAYGVVPISPTNERITDYNPVQESGNAFVYNDASVWSVYAAIVRAVETSRFPFDWRTIQRNGMESVK